MNASTSTLRPAPHFPVRARPAATAAPAPRVSAPGSWRYAGTPRRRNFSYAAGLALSVALHTAIFFGFSDTKPAARPIAPAAEKIIAMEMPPLPPEEPEQRPSELQDTPPAASVAVPQLMEVPQMVALNDFQQLVDLRPQTEIDRNALRQLAIPVNHGRGGAGGAGLGDVFKLTDLDRVPQPISQPPPAYPQNVRSGAEEEVVVLNFIVDHEGAVRDARVVRSTNSDFDRAALNGVAKWKFKPGMKGGRKVATLMELPLKFVITGALE